MIVKIAAVIFNADQTTLLINQLTSCCVINKKFPKFFGKIGISKFYEFYDYCFSIIDLEKVGNCDQI